MRVVGLGDERETPSWVERPIVESVQAIGDPGDRYHADPLVLPADSFAGRRVTQEEPALGALHPETQPLGQNASSFRAAAATRSTDGMYASSICQYGYGTS